MEHQLNPEELRAALAERNTEPATRDEILAARQSILSQGNSVRSATFGFRANEGKLRQRIAIFALGIGALTFAVVGTKNTPLFRGATPHGRTYATQPGQRATITLPDGSTLVLNADSKATIPSDFGATNRRVELVGEGKFTVTSISNTPFTVIANKSETRVLGTTFGIRAYKEDSSVRIAVQNGRVSFASIAQVDAKDQSRRAKILSAGNVASVSESGDVQMLANDADAMLGWSEGRLKFSNAFFADVARDLSRQYAVPIQVIDPKLAATRVSMTITIDQGMVSALDLLASIGKASVVRRGTGYVLIPTNDSTQ